MILERHVPFSRPCLGEEEVEAVARVLRGGWLTTGPECDLFEREFSEMCGSAFAQTCSSATAALEIALAACDVGPGCEVLTSPYTFASTVLAVGHRNAVPVFVPLHEDSYCMDVEALRRLVSQRYRKNARGHWVSPFGRRLAAFLPVHFAGAVHELPALYGLAGDLGVPVVEDAAHACGARDQEGQAIGSREGLACFSFYSNKNITTGEGGMIASGNPRLAERVKRLGRHGMDRSNRERYSGGRAYYQVVEPGIKGNMPDVLAALGRVQLRRLERINASRARLAQRYSALLQDRVGVPRGSAWGRGCAWHLFPVQVPPTRRDTLLERLAQKGIEASVHFIPVHRHPFFARTAWEEPRDGIADRLYAGEISLPLFPDMGEDDVAYVAASLEQLLQEA